MAQIVNGTKILLKLKISGTTKLLAGQLSGGHDVKVDLIETTSKLSAGGAKTYIAGEHTATYKVDCVVDPNDTANATYDDVYNVMINKQEVDYVYGGIQTGETTFTGKAIITSLSQSAQKSSTVTFSIDLQVTGLETKGTVA